MRRFLKYILILPLISFSSIKSDLIEATNLVSTSKINEAKKILINIVDTKNVNKEEQDLLEIARYNLANIYFTENNTELAKKYYSLISKNENNRSIIAVKSNQKLLSISIGENNINEAIKQIEKLNIRTMYREIPFLANQIYLYEENNKIEKLEDLNIKVINKLSNIERGRLYYLVSLIYLENKRLDKANMYYDKLVKDNSIENNQLGYIGFANISYQKGNYTDSIENLNKAKNINKNSSIAILEQLQELFTLNKEYKSSYEVLKEIYKKSYKDANILIELIKYANFLEKVEDANLYLKKLEDMNISNYDLGVKMAAEGLFEYSEIYLLKAMEEGEKIAVKNLLDIYFSNLEEKKLKNLLKYMLDKDIITKDKYQNILKEFNHYREYINKGV